MSQTVPLVITANASGLTVGYAVLNLDRSEFAAFTTAGVTETNTPGTYAVTGGVVVPTAGGYIAIGSVDGDPPEVTWLGEADVDPAPDLNAIADAVLLRDWTALTGAVPSRSTLNALRFLRNKWLVFGGELSVYEEDDIDIAWTAELEASSSANPITGSMPR
jgi:hypothetical protein